MDLSRLPIWAVYLFAPMLILVVSSKAIFDSNNPVLLESSSQISSGMLNLSSCKPYLYQGRNNGRHINGSAKADIRGSGIR